MSSEKPNPSNNQRVSVVVAGISIFGTLAGILPESQKIWCIFALVIVILTFIASETFLRIKRK